MNKMPPELTTQSELFQGFGARSAAMLPGSVLWKKRSNTHSRPAA